MTRGKLAVDEMESGIKLMKRMVESISGKVGLSPESIYARITVKFSGDAMSRVILGAAEDQKGDQNGVDDDVAALKRPASR